MSETISITKEVDNIKKLIDEYNQKMIESIGIPNSQGQQIAW